MKVNELVDKAHKNAKAKGFWDDMKLLEIKASNRGITRKELETRIDNAVATRIALIHSEVSEVLEELRVNGIDTLGEELADVILRTADLAGRLDINLEYELVKKMAKNKSREYKHGKRF